ncbi:MAG: hypothetical protein HY872_08730 [Chloroflexi bacterium]|nr:hypothetical protein [Chloroflexota bacterium]
MKQKLAWQHWRERWNALGLSELADELLRPGSPLAFLAAQGLRVAQPLLSSFADPAAPGSLAALADRLENSASPSSTETPR